MTPPARERVLVYGNCQGGWLTRALEAQDDIRAQYEFVYLSDYMERPPNHPINEPGFISTCSVVIWQTASGCKPPWFVPDIPPHVRQIRYPTLWLKLLWPTYAVDPRNVREPDHPWGRYPYGDRLVMKLLADGVAPADIPQRYVETDLNTIVNLDRFTERSLAELRFNDRQSDVAITPFIERRFRERKLFGTVNHPTFLILEQILQGVIAALTDTPAPEDPPEPDRAAEVLGEEETPLHPQIISHFGLTWVRPDTVWRYRSARFSLEEYLRAYAEFRPVPLESSAATLLHQVRHALQRRDLDEASRLLLVGANTFPQRPEFLQSLGTIALQRGRLLEAEKVFRFALSRHPEVAELHCKLGIVLVQRRFNAHAIPLFQEALRLDPANEEARRSLARLTQPAATVSTPQDSVSAIPVQEIGGISPDGLG